MADVRFNGYTGKKCFSVLHPDYPPITAAAPDENSAIVAAAKKLGVRWQTYGFYSWCSVYPLKDES